MTKKDKNKAKQIKPVDSDIGLKLFKAKVVMFIFGGLFGMIFALGSGLFVTDCLTSFLYKKSGLAGIEGRFKSSSLFQKAISFLPKENKSDCPDNNPGDRRKFNFLGGS